MTITPEVFFDIFILCLFWQNTYYTTVDHVSLALFRLGVITEKQRANLFKDWRVQSIFIRNISRPPIYREKYSSLLVKQRYLKAIETDNCNTIGAIIKRYGQKIEEETGGNPYKKE